MSAGLLASALFVLAPSSAAAPDGAHATTPAEIPAAAVAKAEPARRTRGQAAFSDPFGGTNGGSRSVVFGDPFATPAARHRPYEAQNVHAQFDDTPRRRRRAYRGGWGYGLGWGLGIGYWGAGYYGYGRRFGYHHGYYAPYGYYASPRYSWRTGVGVGIGVGVGVGLGSLFF